MIAGIFHQGSGLGNQLMRYVATRSLAEKKGYEYGMINPELFKGSSFMKLDMGKPVNESDTSHKFTEKKVIENGIDIRSYDPEINFVEDSTIIDGEFQDEGYFDVDKVREWLKVDLIDLPENLCIINFRGGEYVGVKELFLTRDYWEGAIHEMLKIRPDMKFIVTTDDVETAQLFFPNFMVRHNMAEDYISIQSAHYLILSNSSFAIFPALLNQNAKKIIAPRYWARRNIGVWAMPSNYYRKFSYL